MSDIDDEKTTNNEINLYELATERHSIEGSGSIIHVKSGYFWNNVVNDTTLSFKCNRVILFQEIV